MKSENKDNSLVGKRIVLFGGSSGIGLATAKAAVEDGALVVIVSGNEHQISNALKELPQGTEGYFADLTNEEEVKQVFEKVGNFDHLVFAAGERSELTKLSAIEIEDVKRYFNLQYYGAVTAVKCGTPYIYDGGSIVLTSGIDSLKPDPGWFLGASICTVMEGFTRTKASELKSIRINVVSSGVVLANLWPGLSETDRQEVYNYAGEELPSEKEIETAEIAEIFLYCMRHPFITGRFLVTDGGMHLFNNFSL